MEIQSDELKFLRTRGHRGTRSMGACPLLTPLSEAYICLFCRPECWAIAKRHANEESRKPSGLLPCPEAQERLCGGRAGPEPMSPEPRARPLTRRRLPAGASFCCYSQFPFPSSIPSHRPRSPGRPCDLQRQHPSISPSELCSGCA